ncbi:MAG: cytochrome P450 [Pyrinomonadaceae bacterium]
MSSEVIVSSVSQGTPRVPPSPKAGLFGGHFRRFRRDPAAFLWENAQEHGDLFYFRIGPQHAYCVTHPDLIKEVLVTKNQDFIKGRALQRSKRLLGNGLLTNEGDAHRRQRRLVLPAFHRDRINTYAETMIDQAARLSADWRGDATIDADKQMMQLTLGIVAKTLFNADVTDSAKDVGQAMTTIFEMFPLLLMPFSELLEKLPLPHVRRFDRARAQLDEIIYRFINERRASGVDQGDLLSMLLAARDEETDGAGMTDEQVRDEALTLFIAGHETTANALVWTWYLLSQNPEVEARLHAELDLVLEVGRPLTPADLPKLVYTERVIAESMRLYPPAWAVGRKAVRDCQIGEYTIPANSLILVNIFGVHRDPRFFTDPERFDPDRWSAEEKERRHAYSYVPFGGGIRRCIGENFAWMEEVLVLAALARNWRLRLDPEQRVATHPLMTLRPRFGMRMKLERRL